MARTEMSEKLMQRSLCKIRSNVTYAHSVTSDNKYIKQKICQLSELFLEYFKQFSMEYHNGVSIGVCKISHSLLVK